MSSRSPSEQTKLVQQAVTNLRHFLLFDNVCSELILKIKDFNRAISSQSNNTGIFQSRLNECKEKLEARAIQNFPNLYKYSSKIFYAILNDEHAEDIDDVLQKLYEVQTGKITFATATNHGISKVREASARAGRALPQDFFNVIPENTPTPHSISEK